jgi:hypothetical protein
MEQKLLINQDDVKARESCSNLRLPFELPLERTPQISPIAEEALEKHI